jgi:hypothetical protein
MMTKKAIMMNNKWPRRFDGMRHASLPVTDKHCQYCLYQYMHELEKENTLVCIFMEQIIMNNLSNKYSCCDEK